MSDQSLVCSIHMQFQSIFEFVVGVFQQVKLIRSKRRGLEFIKKKMRMEG